MKDYERMRDIFSYIKEEDMQAIKSMFTDRIDVDLPTCGRIYNDEVFLQFMLKAQEWMEKNNPSVELVDVTTTEKHAVFEFSLPFMLLETERTIAVAIVCDLEGDKISKARVYYPTTYILGHHTLRRALYDQHHEDPDCPEVFARYLRAIIKADLDAVVPCFEPEDGYFQAEDGRAVGKDNLREFFRQKIFGEGGEVYLQHGNLIQDETHYIIEFFFRQYGDKKVTPQAGLAVYCASPNGLLSAARIYDDVVFDNRIWP